MLLYCITLSSLRENQHRAQEVAMKMPGTKGFITISRDYEKSVDCAAASSQLAESLVIGTWYVLACA